MRNARWALAHFSQVIRALRGPFHLFVLRCPQYGSDVRASAGPRVAPQTGVAPSASYRPGGWFFEGFEIFEKGKTTLPIKVMLVDDDDIVRTGLRLMLEAKPNPETVAEAKSRCNNR